MSAKDKIIWREAFKKFIGVLDSVGENEGGMIWEDNVETYILPYAK